MSEKSDTLFEFPCRFSVKAMGLASPGFEALVIKIVGRDVPDIHLAEVATRPSSGGKYLAVTITFEATSKTQLDAIYQALTDHDQVLTSL
ncbi:MAG: DUF493 domain-containing protein [Candidatus Sedimenticola endophacoides]